MEDPEAQTAPLLKSKPKDLHDAVAELRAHGVARAEGKPIPGVNAFSAPAFDHEGRPVIVVAALGRQDRFPADWNSDAESVRDAAAETSSGLGWRAVAPVPSDPVRIRA